MLDTFCRRFFVAAVAWPVTLFWTGYALHGKDRLPAGGPAIVIANHNSHLDALMLLTLFPLARVPSIRVAAAADYFFSGKIRRFVAERFMGLLPMHRSGRARRPLAPLAKALEDNQIVIVFPEGTRGNPDALEPIKPGLWHLARRFPEVPIHPVYLHGPGRSLPKGAWIPVPLFADVRVGEPFFFEADKELFLEGVHTRFMALRAETLAGKTAMHDEEDALDPDDMLDPNEPPTSNFQE